METTILSQTGELARLAAYAAEGDKRKFVAAVEAMNLKQCQPTQLIKIIDLALSLELSTLAIKLAQQGLHLFPHNEQMHMAARVLSPPIVHKIDFQSPLTVNSSTEWLQQHASQMGGNTRRPTVGERCFPERAGCGYLLR